MPVILLASAVLYALSLMYVNFFLAFSGIALALYVIIKSGSAGQAFSYGALFGAISSLLLNYWMLPVVVDYARGSIGLGLICYLASAGVLAVFFGVQFCLSVLFKYQGAKYASLLQALFLSSFWVFFEWLRTELFSSIPWLSYTAGITQARSLFLIQPAAIGGVLMLSFITLLAAGYAALSYYHKNLKLLLVSLTIIAVQYISGYFLFDHSVFDPEGRIEKTFSAALIMPGLSPEMVWTEESADGLVSHLFSLNERAVKSKPDLIIWTETVVPWTYSTDDDFLKELAGKTMVSNTHTIIGMNSLSAAEGSICNSAYYLDSSGIEKGRYDKQDLLTLVEKPLFSETGNLILPFMSSYDQQMRQGSHSEPVETRWGKAGVLICNESTNSSLAKGLVEKGAGFLVNLGNDSWFSGRFITSQHFYNCRLRAVENRKDILINNNMGLCGLVRASGEIALRSDGKKSDVLLAEGVRPNTLKPWDFSYFMYFITCILLFAVCIVLYPYLKTIIKPS